MANERGKKASPHRLRSLEIAAHRDFEINPITHDPPPTTHSMPPSSNKSVSSASSNPKKHKKKMKKRDKHRDKKEAVTDQHHHKKHREHKEPKEPRRGNSGKSSSSKRHRPFLGPRVYWLVLAVVSVVLSSVGVYNYKTTTRSPMRPTGAPVPGTNAPNTCSEEGQKEQAVLRQRRQKPINLRPLLRSLAHKFQVLAIVRARGVCALTSFFGQGMLFSTITLHILVPYFLLKSTQRIFTHVIESPFFPEARATRLRSRVCLT